MHEFTSGSFTDTVSESVPGPIWVKDRFQDRYEFIPDSRNGMGSLSVPVPVWVQYSGSVWIQY